MSCAKNGAWVGDAVRDATAIDDNYVYHRITSVETTFATRTGPKRTPVRVYDLDVPSDESFVVGGATVHNCRLGMKRPVLIMYLVAEGTADEHVAHALLAKLPAVEAVAKDETLAEFAVDLRGNEDEVAAGLWAKITSDDDEGEDTDGTDD
jgi:hypothetical protein